MDSNWVVNGVSGMRFDHLGVGEVWSRIGIVQVDVIIFIFRILIATGVFLLIKVLEVALHTLQTEVVGLRSILLLVIVHHLLLWSMMVLLVLHLLILY